MKKSIYAVIVIFVIVLIALFGDSFFVKENDHYGFWSIVPPFIVIFFAFWTREVLISLFIGICCGGLISGEINIIESFLLPSIGTKDFAMILIVYLWALGGLMGVWTRTGGAKKFSLWACNKIVKGPRSAKFFVWIMGLVFHQGGTISTVLTGVSVKPVSDAHNVSHEELSYVVDSTSSPAATLIPFNIWPFYISSLIVGTIPVLKTKMDGVYFFLASVPLNLYAIFAIFITFLFSIEKLPFIPGRKMRDAIKRSRNGLGLDSNSEKNITPRELFQEKVPADYKPGLLDFFAPIGTILGVAIIPFIYSFFILGNKVNPTLLISEAFFLALLIAITVALIKGMSLNTIIEGFIDGCKGVTIGAIILALAISLKEVAVVLGTADYVVSLVGEIGIPALLPVILMVVCMIVAFSTGTSWGTYAVVFPIAMPLAWSVNSDPLFLQICFAAVLGGAVFGDQCSPISDTTVLSSLATGCDLMDHVITQLPLALAAAFLSIIGYLLLYFTII